VFGFTVSQENFYKGYIFESASYTINLQSKEQLNRRHFSNDDFDRYASKLYSLKYCDLFDEHNVFLTGENIHLQFGINLAPLQMFTFRNVCSTAKVRYRKKDEDKQKSIQIETFFYQRKKGSSHLRKILLRNNEQGIPHNINKFARNMDIVITGEQSKVFRYVTVEAAYRR
jgi:hypothetical protein